MGLISNIALLWKEKDKIALASEELSKVRDAVKATPKSGFGSSEFLVVILMAAITLYNGFYGNATGHSLDPKFATEIAAILAGLYLAFRTFLKLAQQALVTFHSVLLSVKPAPIAAPAPAVPAPAVSAVAVDVAVATPPAA